MRQGGSNRRGNRHVGRQAGSSLVFRAGWVTNDAPPGDGAPKNCR